MIGHTSLLLYCNTQRQINSLFLTVLNFCQYGRLQSIPFQLKDITALEVCIKEHSRLKPLIGRCYLAKTLAMDSKVGLKSHETRKAAMKVLQEVFSTVREVVTYPHARGSHTIVILHNIILRNANSMQFLLGRYTQGNSVLQITTHGILYIIY